MTEWTEAGDAEEVTVWDPVDRHRPLSWKKVPVEHFAWQLSKFPNENVTGARYAEVTIDGKKHDVEFTVDHDKKEATIYVLGSDEKTATPIKATDETLLLSINVPSFQVDLKAVPLDGESDGASSRYVGQHENLGIVREFAGTISAEVDGTPYAGDFKEEPHGDHDH